MARNRLTHRSAAADKTPYPGTVNQDRKDPEMDQYHTFEQTVNHELPDMRTEWKNDQRNEIGFGIPTVASVRSAASKAVKLAVLLLGEKAPEDVIEAQAREFMKLGGKGLEASLLNFASTEKLYAEEEKKDEEVKAAVAVKAEEAPKVEDKKEEVKASAHKCSCSTATTAEPVAAVAVKAEEAPKVEDKKEEVKASVAVKAEEAPKVEDKKEEVKAAEVAPVAVKAEEAPKVEDKKEEVKASVVAEDKKDEMEVEAADDDKKDEEVVAADDEADEDKEVAASELDVQLGGDEMDEVKNDDAEDELLASLYAGEEDAEEEKPEAKKASAKKGIKKLGGQPKLASAPKTASDDLSGIWASAPDVSNIFE